MHHATAVRIAKRIEQLPYNADAVLDAEPLLAVEIFLQFLATDEFHDNESLFCIFAIFINSDDFRMREPPDRLRLVA